MSKINHVTRHIAKIACLGAIATPLLMSTGWAAELEEVIVTAQRKTESLQEVPVAVSAISQDTLEKTDTHDLSGIALQIPGLTFSSFSPGQNIVSLRGAASNDDGAGTDGSVAVFVDDVYLGRISNINPEMFDLERIEVLRGPQGTLYGKNTIGGAINIISTKPNHEEFSGKVRVNVGNYGRTDFAALVTGPLSENLAFKVSASLRRRDGWAENKELMKDQKDDNSNGLKAQLLFGTDRLEALFSFDYNDLDIEDMGRVPVRANYDGIGPDGPNPAIFRGSYEATCGDVTGSKCVAGPIDGYAKREAYGGSAKISWHLKDTMELISISAYRKSEADWNMDSAGAAALALNDDIFDTTKQFSQEFRLVHAPTDQISYVAGLWYLTEDTDRTECFDLNGTGPASSGVASAIANTDCTPLMDGSEGYQQVNKTTSYAAFGQIDWRITEQLTLALGGRYSYEKKVITNEAVTNMRIGADPLAACNSRPPGVVTASGLCIISQNLTSLTLDENWSAFTPKVSLSYRPADNMNLYVTFSQGFKSGGFGAAPQTEADARRILDQEEATSYEIGFKGLFSKIFRLNAALFHTQYDGLQIQNFGSPPGAGATSFGRFQTFNAGGAKVTGLELEGTALIGNYLTVSGFASINKSKFGTTNIANAAASADQNGNDLLRTPELKYGVNLDYIIPLSDGSEISLGGNYNFVDDQRGDLPSYAVQPAFALMDCRVGWTNSNETLQLTAWMKNVLDEEYIAHIYTIAGGTIIAVYGDPRMFGGTATYRF